MKFITRSGVCSRAWTGLYIAASKNPLPKVIPIGPSGAQEYLRTLYRGTPPVVANEVDCCGEVTPGNRALVLFSGGKDSTAAALLLGDRGLDVTLLNVRGINPAYPQEQYTAERLASMLKMPLLTAEVVVAKGAYIENPTKNQLLLAMALDVAVKNNISHIATGITANVRAATTNFSTGFSDAVEMHEAAADWAERAITGITVERRLLPNDTVSLVRVARAGLLEHIGSCMGAHRFKNSLNAQNTQKYGVRLMPDRCGSCYKCALEWLHTTRLGVTPQNLAYARHCLSILRTEFENMLGRRPMNDYEVLATFIDEQQLTGTITL